MYIKNIIIVLGPRLKNTAEGKSWPISNFDQALI